MRRQRSDREDDMTMQRISVLGAGSWGTALASTARRAGRDVMLWTRDPAYADKLSATRRSPALQNVAIDPGIRVTASLADAARADAILVVVPAQATREVVGLIGNHVASGTPLIACAKGIERGTRKFMTEIIAECAQKAVPAILSGPSFAHDVVRGLPTAVTLAAPDEMLAAALSQALASPAFRPYHSTDIRGVEIGGAAKNVFAIAAGVVSGRGLGSSAAAALTTRGFGELLRFGKACGARNETLTGLSGLGDLILSCSSPQSRNFTFGVNIGMGHSPGGLQKSTGLAEGAFTASVLTEMARQHNIDMPIVEAVSAVVDGRLSVDAAIEGLLARPVRSEI